MFRLDDDRVVDATISGGLARYINHSCNPNCVTEKVEVDRELRIIIFAKRRIARGEEVSISGFSLSFMKICSNLYILYLSLHMTTSLTLKMISIRYHATVVLPIVVNG